MVEQILPRLHAVVLNGLRAHAQPRLAVEGAQLHLGVCRHLAGDGLDLAGLDVEVALKQVHRAKRAHVRLVPVDGGEVIRAALFEKFIDFLHTFVPFLRLCRDLNQIFFEQTHRVVRLLGAPQPLVARILLAVDVAHAGRDEALGVFVHERLIDALIGDVRLLDVDDKRVAHDLPGGKAGHAPVDAQQPRKRGIGGKVAQEFPHAPLLRLRAGAVLVIAAGEVVEKRAHLRQVLRRDALERPVRVQALEVVDVVALPVEAAAAEAHHVLRVVEIVEPRAHRRDLHDAEACAQVFHIGVRSGEKLQRLPHFAAIFCEKIVCVSHILADRCGKHRAETGKLLAQHERAVQLERRVLKIRLPEHGSARRIIAQARAARGKITCQARNVPHRQRLERIGHALASPSCAAACSASFALSSSKQCLMI